MSRKINYKSDFDFTSKLIDPAGKVIPFPEYDWSARYHTSLRNVCYVASCRDGVYTNCFRESDGSIHFVFDKHGLGTGQLRCEFRFDNPNPIYTSAIQRLFDPQNIDIELIDGRSDSASPAEIQSMYPYIKGEPFTYEDFTAEQLTEIKRPAVEAAAEATEAANKATEAAQAADAAAQKAEYLNDTASEAESLRTEAEQERRIAETSRAEEFATWQGEIDSKADKSELSNVLAEEPLTPGNFPDINTYTREELKKDLFRDLWLATLAMFPLLPTYDDDVAATLSDGSQYGLNGLAFGYDTALKVIAWSKPKETKANGIFNYDYTMPADVPTLFPFYAIGTQDMSSAWRACNYVKVISVYSAFGVEIRPIQAINLFASCIRLKKIYGVVDFKYMNDSQKCLNAFGQLNNLESIQLARIHCDITIANTPLLSIGSVEYMVEYAINTTPITITVHPDVYAKLTDESNTEWHQVLIDAAEKNITFATV